MSFLLETPKFVPRGFCAFTRSPTTLAHCLDEFVLADFAFLRLAQASNLHTDHGSAAEGLARTLPPSETQRRLRIALVFLPLARGVFRCPNTNFDNVTFRPRLFVLVFPSIEVVGDATVHNFVAYFELVFVGVAFRHIDPRSRTKILKRGTRKPLSIFVEPELGHPSRTPEHTTTSLRYLSR